MPADVITQADLQHASELQLTVWHSEKQCREYVQSLARRKAEGAAIEDGPLGWDAENEMVRSNKKELAR